MARRLGSLEDALQGAGWTAFALDGLSDESDAELVALLLSLGQGPTALPELRSLISGASWSAACFRRRFACASESSLDFERVVRRNALESAASSVHTQMAAKSAPVGSAAYARWPSRVKRSMKKAAGDTALRQMLEDRERAKWSARLAGILAAAKLPAALNSSGQLCELSELKRASKGRRASTLKAHVRYVEGFLAWLSVATGLLWPSSAMDLVKYLEMRAEEPCGRTVPGTIQRAIVFMEAAGEVASCDTIAKQPAVLNMLEELNTTLGAAVRTKRRAWQLPASLVLFWERTVCDESAEVFVRGFAWFKLVKLWTGMRWSDTTGLPPSSLRLDSRGLAGALDRTKTSGAGKKVERMCVYVSFGAYLELPSWLEIGFGLWKQMGIDSASSERDFFLTRPNKSLNGCVLSMARYSDAAAMSLALSRRWTFLDEIGETRPVILPCVAACWTEHSERSTLATWARCCGVQPEVTKRLCRWQQTVDEDYVRASRLLIEGAQECIASAIKAGKGGQDILDESNLWDHLWWKFGDEVGVAFLGEQITRLRFFGEGTATPSQTGAVTPPVAFTVDESPEDAAPAPESLETDNELTQALGLDLAGIDDTPLGETLDEVSSSEEPPCPPASVLQKFFISITGSARKRRLHLGGECWRIPGRDYAVYEEFSEVLPESSLFHAICKQCFPRGIHSDPPAEESASSGSSETSEAESVP